MKSTLYLVGIYVFNFLCFFECSADTSANSTPPILAFVQSSQKDVLIHVVGKTTDIPGLIVTCREAISRFGAIGGVILVFKDDVSLETCLNVAQSLIDAKLTPIQLFVCPAKLWNPRSVTPAQWREIKFGSP